MAIVILLLTIIVSSYIIFKTKNIKKEYIQQLKNRSVKIYEHSISFLILIIVFCSLFFYISFIFIYPYLNNLFASLNVSILFALFPVFIYQIIENKKKEKLISLFPNIAIRLKNYIQINPDIVYAFQKIHVEQEFKSFIDTFNVSIRNGVGIYDAFDKLAQDIAIPRIADILMVFQNCYVSGGNFNQVLDKYIKKELEIRAKKEKEKQETFSSKFMLILLVGISVFLIFFIMFSMGEFYPLYTTTIVGKLIIFSTTITYTVIFYLYYKINKLED